MYIQMLFLAPPAQTLHTSCIGQSSSPNHLRKLSVSNTHPFFLSMFRSLTLSTTQPPFSTLLRNVFTSHTRHCTPCRALSLSFSLSHSHAKFMHCLSSPKPLVHTHARCISRSLPRDCLTLSSARRTTLAQSRSLYPILV